VSSPDAEIETSDGVACNTMSVFRCCETMLAVERLTPRKASIDKNH
jgi:hypothetical protein